uniref:branched-chain amino acid ABC transporter permease n=1 Tax=Ndongobacter massiliensis TaxID=1871025 RepID=UPI000931DF1D|nr:branched-chain amino acid ABC transporter permease [Ndongobacter massiliensis]
MLEVFNNINTAFCGLLGINSYHQGVIIMISINVIAVLGMSILTGFTRLFSFGNAGFMSIGAYTAAILTVEYHVNFLVAIMMGAAFAGFIAFLLGSITLRLKGDYFLITCLGFGECVRVLFNYTKDLTGGSAGYPGIPPYSNALFSALCAILAFFIAWRFIHSKYGRNLTSIRENEMAAEAVGIDAFRVKRMSFLFSAVYAGWAGALYGGYLMYIVPASFNLAKSCELITTTVIGGLGSLTGSTLGAMIVTLLPEIFRGLANYRMLLYGIAVVFIILFKPSGLYGYKEFSLKRTIRWFRNIPLRLQKRQEKNAKKTGRR